MLYFEQFKDSKYDGEIMSSDWVSDLERSDSRIHKEKVIEKALMSAKLGSASAQGFLFNCYLAYNPYYVYGVKQVPETQGLTGKPNPWTEFWALCEALRTRSVTGNHMRSMIEQCSQKFDSDEWNMLARRVLIKDLRCGISEKTLNKVLGRTEWAIPIFSCQLAQDSDNHPNKMSGVKRLEVKLDGVRVIAICNGPNVTLYSRNGKPFDNFPQIAEAIAQNRQYFQVGNRIGGKFVLDGEIVGESFQKLMRQAHRKSDAKTDGMVYHIFDFLPLDDFERGYWNAQLYKRLEILDRAREFIASVPEIKIMPGIDVDLNTSKGQDQMRRFANDCVEQGHEGIMIKDLGAPYECRRSSFWMKWKPTITIDLNIIEFEEGTGRNQGRLGAMVCEGVDNERSIRVNVGSGFSDLNRDEYWQRRHELLGNVVEVEADAITQNQDGSYSLRFPRFVRFRGFEPGEKF
jgi:DNA ligase-1